MFGHNILQNIIVKFEEILFNSTKFEEMKKKMKYQWRKNEAPLEMLTF